MPSFNAAVALGTLHKSGELQCKRLDLYIAEDLRLMSRSQIKQRSKETDFCAMVNGKKEKLSKLIKDGDSLHLTWNNPVSVDLIAQKIPLDIVFENNKVIVINKQQGLVVHPGAGNYSGTLVNALLYHFGSIDVSNAALRPFIVHRLDKDTSGIIIAAKDVDAISFLSDQFKERRVQKTYAAIVQGVPKTSKGKICGSLIRDPKDRKRFKVSTDHGKGKPALTYYRVVKTFNFHACGYSLLKLRPKTGRTHQLRVHLQSIGHPIIGDVIYNKKDKLFSAATLMLHAKNLRIQLPCGDPNSPVLSFFTSPLPLRFKKMMRTLHST
ncbi:MAG: RluA family pseudouridine synthase [Termitinemataceae bacterium]|nr:MAG: RluA family pseudouridine synthase [Termitinemataceae bacterium]